MNLTKLYPFDAMSVGSSFVVYSRFQHARVAASEYGRKHGMCFTCRMEEDHGQGRTMRVHRVELNQAEVDRRGRNGHREITVPSNESHPTQAEFNGWLDTLKGSYAMPLQYAAMYPQMMQWTMEYSHSLRFVTAGLWHDGTLMITRIT